MAVETSVKQMALARNIEFQERTQAMMAKVAVDVLGEAGSTPYHGQRANYAQRVIQSPQMSMNQAITVVCMGDSVTAGTVYDETTKTSTCSITDPNLQSQIERLWNAMAGIDTPAAGM